MGARFGHDFSRVRIHTDARAGERARALHAAAYTVGNDIVFAPGRYRPDTGVGRALLAHELAHVVQQRQASLTVAPGRAPRNGRVEHEAWTASRRATAGMNVGLLPSLPQQAVQCADEDELQNLESGVPQRIGSAVMGDTGWRFTVAVMQGMTGGIKAHISAGDVSSTANRFLELRSSWRALGAFVGGYFVGLAKGIVSPIVDLWNLVKGAVQLEASVMEWIVGKAVELFTGRTSLIQRASELYTRLKAVRDKAFDAVTGFLQHPFESLKQIQGWLDSMLNAALAKARDIGHSAADQIFAFLNLDWYEMGKEIGTVVGTILVQVLMMVFTAEIGNALSAAGKALGEVGSWVIGKLGKLFGAVKSLASSVIKALEGLAGTALKFIEGLANEIKGLIKMIVDLLGPAEEADLAVAGGGKGTASLMSEAKGVGIPDKLPPGVRTNPVTVADLKGQASTGSAAVKTTTTPPTPMEKFLASGGEIKKLPPGPVPDKPPVQFEDLGGGVEKAPEGTQEMPRQTALVRTSEQAGREGGLLAAKRDGIVIDAWDNPESHIHEYGRGFDGVGTQGSKKVVLEFKGESSQLAKDQMSDAWVGRKLAELEHLRDPKAQELLAAAKKGLLEGRTYRTKIIPNQGLQSALDGPARVYDGAKVEAAYNARLAELR